MRTLVLVIASATALTLAASFGGCVTNAATGHSQLNALSREEEIQIGQTSGPELAKEYGGGYGDPEIQAYLREVGMKLVAHVEGDYASLPWEFTLLDSDVINAFSLPGGKVFFSRGLAEKFTTEAELAAVLGHEVGHVTAEHADRRIAEQTEAQIGIAVASVLLGATTRSDVAQVAQELIGGAGQGFLLKFSRDEENEADSLGLRYMTKAGYNPRGMLGVMEVLKSATGAGGQPEWLSTHPLPQTRLERIGKALQQQPYADAVRSPASIVGEREFKARFLDKIVRHPKQTGTPAQPASGQQQNMAPVKKKKG